MVEVVNTTRGDDAPRVNRIGMYRQREAEMDDENSRFGSLIQWKQLPSKTPLDF